MTTGVGLGDVIGLAEEGEYDFSLLRKSNISIDNRFRGKSMISHQSHNRH